MNDVSPRAAGFYGDLERLLRQQLAANPDQLNLRLKLLEVYYEAGRDAEFLREMQALSADIQTPEHAAERDHIASMGRTLGLSDPLFERQAPKPQEPARPSSAPRARPLFQRRIGEDGRYREPFAALATDYSRAQLDPKFQAELDLALERLAQRPAPLHDAQRLSRATGGARICFKREDLSPHGSRLQIAVAGQALLAQRLGKTTLVTSTASGARGLVTASMGAQLGLKVVIFMDRDDVDRHKLPSFRLRLHGVELKLVNRRDLPNRDVRHAALDFWAQQADQCFPVMGLDAVPPPYDLMTRDIPAAVGREARRQVQSLTGREPDLLVARGDDSADAIGFFEPFLADAATRLVCVEATRDLGAKRKDELYGLGAGPSPETLRRTAQAELANMEYAPVAREHGFLRASGRIEYVKGLAEAGRRALLDLCGLEGVLPSIETAQVAGWACREAAKLKPEQTVVVMLAEKAEADLPEISRVLDGKF